MDLGPGPPAGSALGMTGSATQGRKSGGASPPPGSFDRLTQRLSAGPLARRTGPALQPVWQADDYARGFGWNGGAAACRLNLGLVPSFFVTKLAIGG